MHLLLILGLIQAPTTTLADEDTRNRLAWMLQCQGCHRADGTGTDDEVPAIAGQVSRFLHVEGGREFLVRVPGVATAPLGDADLASLVNWMLAEFDPSHLPESFTPYEPAEIAALRSKPLGPEVVSERQRLMALLQANSVIRSHGGLQSPLSPPESRRQTSPAAQSESIRQEVKSGSVQIPLPSDTR